MLFITWAYLTEECLLKIKAERICNPTEYIHYISHKIQTFQWESLSRRVCWDEQDENDLKVMKCSQD